MNKQHPTRIGIIGAGFSGTALAAALYRLTNQPIEIILFEKTGQFATGQAYRTPYSFHLLNVCARDMSLYEDDPNHFINWLEHHDHARSHLNTDSPIAEQYAPRCFYGEYLQDILKTLSQNPSHEKKIQLEPQEVIDIAESPQQITLTLSDGRRIEVDKVVFAMGNQPPMAFPFPITGNINTINNPWDYKAPAHIPTHDAVMIVGTGLSMIDTVLTLYEHKHQGPIYAVSRHGLLPLRHALKVPAYKLPYAELPSDVLSLTNLIRREIKNHMAKGGDWRAVISALRSKTPALWANFSIKDKKRFLRHAMAYWNVHRHRVHHEIADILVELSGKNQLQVIAGRVQKIVEGKAYIALRKKQQVNMLPINWVINCLGPSLSMKSVDDALLHALLNKNMVVFDALHLGFAVSPHGQLKTIHGDYSTRLFTLGPLRKGEDWESSAVPEIRKQSFQLARYLLQT